MNFLHIGEAVSGGGAGTVLRDTISILKQNDLDNNHFLMVRNSDSFEDIIDFTFEGKGSMGSSVLSSIFSIKNYIKLKSILNNLNPDVIHMQSIGNLSPSVFLAIKRYKRKKK
ncbi:group 1 glycosyl transferase [Aquimarina agarivorans]|uniref:group 1 glycosyl transferase n=1 Tax=Aquimarina agarivorans TaxID=980584 RepID=UPI000248EB31|nr:group 1 glycosyl transferase [Aquimarina agarivorans]